MTSSSSIPVLYRPSTPADLEAITRIHMEGFEGYRSTLLGPSVVRRLYRWFILHPDAACFTAVCNGDVCGYVVGAPHGFARALIRYTLRHAAAAVILRPALWIKPSIWKGVAVKLLQLLGVRFGPRPASDAPPQRHFALVGIGVDASRRGLGIAGGLMRVFEEAAARRGFPRMTLSVKRGNRAAQRAYEKSGWRIIQEDAFNDLLIFEKILKKTATE
jgi:ribosomal protein S18 acetylase RimI-like enzyme